MIEIAEDVYQIPLFPRQSVNAYLIGTVLVDAGVRSSGAALRRALAGRTLTAHVLTHAHADHQGASAEICTTFNIPLWCGAAAADATARGDAIRDFPNPNRAIPRLQQRFFAGPGYQPTRLLREGDQIGEFVVLDTPGHANGHIALWRARDRTLITGDVITNMNLQTTLPGVYEPPSLFTHNIAQNRVSIRKIAALQPTVVAAGHGPVMRDAARLTEFATRLPA